MAIKRATIERAALSSSVVQQVGDILFPFILPGMEIRLAQMIELVPESSDSGVSEPSWVTDLRQAVDTRGWVAQDIRVTDPRGVESSYGFTRRGDLGFIDGAVALKLTLCAPEASYVTAVHSVTIEMSGSRTDLTVQAPQEEILDLFEPVFDLINATVPPFAEQARETPPFRVFIAYGGGRAWEVVRNYIRDAGYEVDAFTEQERAGQLTLDVVEEMIRTASVAVIVMTGADRMESGALHARQNVVHEAGFAQGAIGRRNTIILREAGVTLPTNVDGLTYIEFQTGEIHTTEERVLGLISRLQRQTNPASGSWPS